MFLLCFVTAVDQLYNDIAFRIYFGPKGEIKSLQLKKNIQDIYIKFLEKENTAACALF